MGADTRNAGSALEPDNAPVKSSQRTGDDLALLRAVESVVIQAGGMIRDAYGRPKEIRSKGRIDLVTRTDVAVEEFLKEQLARLLPQADFLAEESSGQIKPGNLTWIIDPLDGTTNFAHDFPFAATSVALWRQGRVVMGVVNAPMLGECFTAAEGHGAWCNGKPISVSSQAKVEASLVATGFPYNIEQRVENILSNLRRMLLHTQGVRRPGSAAIDLAFTACGRYEAFYETDLKPWDTAAGWLLVTEAGGRVSSFDSATPYTLGGLTILASNGLVHDDMSQLLESPKP